MISTEDLIEIVKILYDLKHEDYKNIRKKDRVWDQTGSDLKLNGEELKKKWKNIRDTYAKYLRALKTTTSQSAKKNYKHWQWAKQREAFRPYLPFANTESNILEEESTSNDAGSSERDMDNSTEANLLDEDIVTKKTPEIATPTNKKRRTNTESTSAVDKVLGYLEKKRRPDDMDATEHIFMGYAKTLKTFSPRRQAMAKMKIAKIIMDTELEHIQEMSWSHNSSSGSVLLSPSGSCENQELERAITPQHEPNSASTFFRTYTDL